VDRHVADFEILVQRKTSEHQADCGRLHGVTLAPPGFGRVSPATVPGFTCHKAA
jgi:hypothetical protein